MHQNQAFRHISAAELPGAARGVHSARGRSQMNRLDKVSDKVGRESGRFALSIFPT